MNTTLHIVIIIALILFVPIAFRKLGLPSIVGLILAGVAIGPYGFAIIERGETIQLLSSIGLYYIMFTSGIEIDLNNFRRNRSNTLIFGSLTFIIPLTIGFAVSYWLLGFSAAASVLLAAMFASHTLMTYPTVSRYGIQRNPVVSVTIGGTMIAVTVSLIIIATISSLLIPKIQTNSFNARLITTLYLLFFIAYLVMIPRVAHFVFKQTNDSIKQFTFVMLVIFCAVLLAQLAGLEGIIGAFFAGLTLNRLIPNLSPLMNRISFVGNAVFIPIFLVSVGMLVDLSAFAQGWHTLYVAAIMSVTALLTKWLAAWATQLACNYSKHERQIMFGLSGAKAAVSLAAVMIGYNIIDSQGNHLFDSTVLNGTVVMILITCTASSIVTERAAKRLGMNNMEIESENQLHQIKSNRKNILLPLANPEHIRSLLDLSFLCADPKQGYSISALRVVKHSDLLPEAEEQLKQVSHIAGAADRPVSCHTQVAANIANGIAAVADKLDIGDIIIGTNVTDIQLEDLNMMRDGKKLITYGNVINQLISKESCQISIYKSSQPINTIRRMIIAVPAQAETESGFMQLYERLRQIAAQTGCETVFYAAPQTTHLLQTLGERPKKEFTAEYSHLDAWEDFLLIAKEIKPNDMLVVIQARKNTSSYNPLFAKMPYMLYRFFKDNNWLVIYPEQFGTTDNPSKLI